MPTSKEVSPLAQAKVRLKASAHSTKPIAAQMRRFIRRRFIVILRTLGSLCRINNAVNPVHEKLHIL
jgi:hypothetical protein